MLAVLVFVWHRVQPPWWDDAGDVAEMLDNQQNGAGYEGIDEYVPNGADVYEIKKDARRVTFEGDGSARIRITQWGPESKSFSANLSQPGKLVLKLFSYPAWKVEVNGRPVHNRDTRSHRPDGHSRRGGRQSGAHYFRANSRPRNRRINFFRHRYPDIGSACCSTGEHLLPL